MSTENISDPAPTSPPSPADSAAPSEAVQTPPATINNGWATAGAATPAPTATAEQATPTQAASEKAAPVQSESAASEKAPLTPSAQAAPAQATATTAESATSEKAAAPSESAAAVEGSTPTPPPEVREQLHRRVESRIAELEAARAQLVGQDGNQARARAIETELQLARNAMSGGWSHVGPLEAAHLSQWLANTGNLIG